MTGTDTSAQVPELQRITPQQYGVGARFSLAVMDSRYAELILAALAAGDASRLQVETTDISTFLGGAEADLLSYLQTVIAAAAGTGAHVSASLLLSRGCPGELQCELPAGGATPRPEIPRLGSSGLRARAHWSLYPLTDGQPSTGHLDDIQAAVDYAQQAGTYAGSDHYATRLDGDLGAVLETIAAGWLLVGRSVHHVVTHATISLNSPTPIAQR